MSDATILLFSYGTLQDENVQMQSFGRRLSGTPDAMPGYTQSLIEITDPDVISTSGKRFHPIVIPSSDPAAAVKGTVFAISESELAAADQGPAEVRNGRLGLRQGLTLEYSLGLELALLDVADCQELALVRHAGFVRFDRRIPAAQNDGIAHADAMGLIIRDGNLR